jgi:hypothetical protein
MYNVRLLLNILNIYVAVIWRVAVVKRGKM